MVYHHSNTPSATATEGIRRSLEVLYSRGGVAELRAFGWRKIYAGYYDDLSEMAEDAARLDDDGHDVYVTLNPCNPALLGRSDNETGEIDPKRTPLTADTDITRRRWVLIDCDPTRPAKVSATDEEKEAARKRAREIWQWLTVRGLHGVVAADSGNGSHLLVPVDLPNDPASRTLVEGFLKAWRSSSQTRSSR